MNFLTLREDLRPHTPGLSAAVRPYESISARGGVPRKSWHSSYLPKGEETAAGSSFLAKLTAPRNTISGHLGSLGMRPSSLKGKRVGFLSRITRVRSLSEGRDQPVTFS